MATTPKEKDANPFTTAAKGAAMRRMKQAQLGMKTTMTLAEAAAKGKEEEKWRVDFRKLCIIHRERHTLYYYIKREREERAIITARCVFV